MNTTLSAGECVSLIGLSGMGKSNLLGFLEYRSATIDVEGPKYILIDCNRLHDLIPDSFFQLAVSRVKPHLDTDLIAARSGKLEGFDELEKIVTLITARSSRSLVLLVDGFDDLAQALDPPFFNLLRALRDTHKYRLTYLLATRRPLQELTEAEKIREFDDLFVANQLWLNPLAVEDAQWTLRRYEQRHNRKFDDIASDTLMALSGRHPGLLVALASAWTEGDKREPAEWLEHPRVERECELLWGDLQESLRSAAYDSPIQDETLHKAGVAVDGQLFSPVFESFIRNLRGTELSLNLSTGEIFRGGLRLDVSLTPKEYELLAYLLDHQNLICEKDDLIRAVWAEDKVFEQGVRDDSLAQLVRRLRVKIEPDPATPSFLLTIPGRGYRLIQPE